MIPLTLKYLFSGKLRVKVLSHFFFHPGEDFHVRQLAAEIEESAGTVARELSRLDKAGILQFERVGNQKRYSLREDSPIIDDLRNVFLKTSGAGAEIRTALEKTDGVELAFIFGSYAAGDANVMSDIDLMIIGDVSDRELAPAVAKIERRLKRQINYVLYSRDEFEKRSKKKGEFIHQVLSRAKDHADRKRE